MLVRGALGGSIELFENAMVLRRRGLSRISKYDLVIAYSEVSQIQVVPPSLLHNGFVFFPVAPMNSAPSIFNMARDERAFVFSRSQKRIALELVGELEHRLRYGVFVGRYASLICSGDPFQGPQPRAVTMKIVKWTVVVGIIILVTKSILDLLDHQPNTPVRTNEPIRAPRDLHGCLDLDTMKRWDSLAEDKQAYAAFWFSQVYADQCIVIPQGTPLTMTESPSGKKLSRMSRL